MEQITKIQFDDLASMSKIRDYPNIFTVDVISRTGYVLARRVDTRGGRDGDFYFATDDGMKILASISS